MPQVPCFLSLMNKTNARNYRSSCIDSQIVESYIYIYIYIYIYMANNGMYVIHGIWNIIILCNTSGQFYNWVLLTYIYYKVVKRRYHLILIIIILIYPALFNNFLEILYIPSNSAREVFFLIIFCCWFLKTYLSYI